MKATLVMAGVVVLAAADDLCLDLAGGDTSNGNTLQIWPCTGGDSQLFAFDGHGWLLHTPSGKCVDGGDLSDGAIPMIWDCNGGDSQLLSYDGATGGIYSGSDNSRCVEVAAAGPGGSVRWMSCDYSGQQYWTNDYANSLIYANSLVSVGGPIYANSRTGKCWDVPGGEAGESQVIQLWDCSGGSNQAWVLHDSLLMTALDLRLCLDLPGDDATNGNWLALYQCTGAPQQQWNYDAGSGVIVGGSSGKCVDLDRSSDEFPHLIIWDCVDVDSQKFSLSAPAAEVQAKVKINALPSCSDLCSDGGHGKYGFISGTAPFCGGECSDCGENYCYHVEEGSVSDYGNGCATGNKVCCCDAVVAATQV